MRKVWQKPLTRVYMVAVSLGLAMLYLSGAAAWAGQTYLNKTTLQAAKVLPSALVAGPLFKTAPKVPNDGFLNYYTVESRYGRFKAISTLALAKLIGELKAIEQMAKIEKSEVFGKSLEGAAVKTGKGLKSLFTDPSGTLQGAATGMGRLFDRMGEAVSGPGPGESEDNRAKQAIGFSKAKREIAAKFGVDVYSANPVLQEHLNQMAWADYAGGLPIAAGTAVVPGATGLIVSTSGGARLLNDLMRTTPPTELRLKNRKKLKALGVNQDLIDLFIGNSVYSPREQTMIVGAMEAMKGVKNRALLVKVALQAQDRDMAFVLTNMAVLYAAYHRHVKPLGQLQPLARVCRARAKDGTAVVALPTDYILWSQRLASAVEALSKEAGGKKPELWVTGQLSPHASQELKKAGWRVETRVEKRLLERKKK